MVRALIGGLVGGLVLFVLGYVFWATPLSTVAFQRAGDSQNAEVQLSLNKNLADKTGTYIIPDYHSQAGANHYSNGPIATVHYNMHGYSPEDMTMILPGLIMALVAGLLFAFGLAAVAGGRSLAELARLVVPVALGFTSWEYLASPIFNHHGWGFWIYSFIAQSVAWIAAGLTIAWFVAKAPAAAREAAPEIVQGPPPIVE